MWVLWSVCVYNMHDVSCEMQWYTDMKRKKNKSHKIYVRSNAIPWQIKHETVHLDCITTTFVHGILPNIFPLHWRKCKNFIFLSFNIQFHFRTNNAAGKSSAGKCLHWSEYSGSNWYFQWITLSRQQMPII